MKIDKAMKEKISNGVWCAVGGAIITMVIGFNWGGWVRGSTSISMGEKMARAAVVERLAPICVSQFNKDPLREENFLALKGKSSWEQEKYIKTQGWATMPYEETPDSMVAAKCSELITKDS
jgi:hypothetical protein